MIDWPRFEVWCLYQANKSRSYRQGILRMAEVLVMFLQDNGLVRRTFWKPGEEIDLHMVIRDSDLTEAGRELMQKPLFNWFAAHDRGRPIEDVRILEKHLKRIREELQTKRSQDQ